MRATRSFFQIVKGPKNRSPPAVIFPVLKPKSEAQTKADLGRPALFGCFMFQSFWEFLMCDASEV
jgi:hypothetical protein